MKNELEAAGLDSIEGATEHEIEEIYDCYISRGCVNRFRGSKVSFPVLSADYYGGKIGEHIIKFDIKRAGVLLRMKD